MAYDKTHKKDYYQFNVKLDYERDADVIRYIRGASNKHDVLVRAIRQHRICEVCKGCRCHTDGLMASILEDRK